MSNNDQPRDATMHDAQLSALYQRTRNDEPPSAPEPVPAQKEPVVEIKEALTAPAVPKNSARLQAAKPRADEQVALVQPAVPDTIDRLSKAEPGSSREKESRLALAPTVAPEMKKKPEESVADIAGDQVETPAISQERDGFTTNSQAMERVTAGEDMAADVRAKRSAPVAMAATTGNSPSPSRLFEAQKMSPSVAKTYNNPKPIGPWLKEIAKLRVEGRDQESARQLQMFKQAHPDIPDEKITATLSTYEREWRDAIKARAAPDPTDDKK